MFILCKKLGNLFNLKFAAKELERSAKRCEKDATNERNKVKRAIEQGNMEGAKIYAENVIRNKNQAWVFLPPQVYFITVQFWDCHVRSIQSHLLIKMMFYCCRCWSLAFRRMSSRVDAVSQRVQTAVSTKRVTQSMAGVVHSMEAAMKSMNLEQVTKTLSPGFTALNVSFHCYGVFW